MCTSTATFSFSFICVRTCSHSILQSMFVLSFDFFFLHRSTLFCICTWKSRKCMNIFDHYILLIHKQFSINWIIPEAIESNGGVWLLAYMYWLDGWIHNLKFNGIHQGRRNKLALQFKNQLFYSHFHFLKWNIQTVYLVDCLVLVLVPVRLCKITERTDLSPSHERIACI